MSDSESMRLDKWLWAARFFKTRKLAADAIAGGKVHLNGQRTKPGKEIKVGARLEIHKEPYMFDITVTALSGQRRPAKEAVLLYDETLESRQNREAESQRRREEKELLPQTSEHRPNKKERRQIHRFKRSEPF